MLPAGWRLAAFDEIDSTNTEAMRRAAAGEHGPLWITARYQSQGRGRSGRAWTSAEGGLAATLLFEPQAAPDRLPQLALVAGVAAHDAIAGTLPPASRGEVLLKWPNDVMIAGAKAAGILVESSIIGSRVVAVIGTGINVAAPAAVGDRPTTSLRLNGAVASVTEVSMALAGSLAHWIATWDGGAGFARVRDAWLARGTAPGTAMTVNAGGGQVAGTFAGLDDDGALLLETGGASPRRFTFGDVALGAR